MKIAYVVRELLSHPAGENEFFTHYEYGTFRTYKEANECAIATKNPRCFPQREQFLVPKQEDPRNSGIRDPFEVVTPTSATRQALT
jgi:hypothetical protein